MEAKTSTSATSIFRYICCVCISLNILFWGSTNYYTGTIRNSPHPKPVVKIVQSKPHSSMSSINDTVLPEKKFLLTFDDPDTYQGPVVEGWPPGKNRSLPLYLRPTEDTFLMRPQNIVQSCKLLVIVHCRPNAFEGRRGVRSTFGQYVKRDLAGDTVIIFLIGKHNGMTRFEQTKLRQEQNTFGDILQVSSSIDSCYVFEITLFPSFQADMIDHYNNLTLKTLFTLKYFLNTSNFETGSDDDGLMAANETYSAAPQYLVKIDDDSYLNLPLLWKSLEQNNISQLLMGSKFSKPVPWQIPKGNKRKKFTQKWACPKYMYNGKSYPAMLSGSGYVMSRSAASCLYNQALKLPFFHLEVGKRLLCEKNY